MFTKLLSKGKYQFRFFLGLVSILCYSIVLGQSNESSGPYMFVSSSNSNSIQRFDAQTGQFIDNFIPPSSGGLNNPQEIIFGPDGHMYITGFGNPSIKKFDVETGQYLGDFTKGYTLRQPTKTTWYSDSLLYVSQWQGNEKVVRFNMYTGDFVDEFTSTGVINGMGQAWDDSGNVFIVSWGTNGNDGNVQRFDLNGVFQEVFVPTGRGGLLGPVNIWYDQGELFVVDWTAGRVGRYDAVTGDFNGLYISGMTRTEGFTFASDGTIFLCDWQLNRVNHYDSNGVLLSVFANVGMSNPNDVIFGPPQNATSVTDDRTLPKQFRLKQNYPNPFNPATTLSFELPKSGKTELTILNLRGQIIRTIFAGDLQAGNHQFLWDGINDFGTQVSSGVYFYNLKSDEFVATRKLVLAK